MHPIIIIPHMSIRGRNQIGSFIGDFHDRLKSLPSVPSSISNKRPISPLLFQRCSNTFPLLRCRSINNLLSFVKPFPVRTAILGEQG